MLGSKEQEKDKMGRLTIDEVDKMKEAGVLTDKAVKRCKIQDLQAAGKEEQEGL